MRILKLFFLVTLFFHNNLYSTTLKGESFLSPEEAFKVSAVENGDMIETKIILGKKIYLKYEKLKYRIIKPKNFELNVTKPKPQKLNGELIYKKSLLVNIPISEISSKVKGDYTLEIDLDGCSDDGICYVNIKKRYNFKIAEVGDNSDGGDIVDILKSKGFTFIILIVGVVLFVLLYKSI